MESTTNHTNRNWYPYPDLGNYFRVEAGALLWCPMNADGSKSLSDGDLGSVVDWDRGVSKEDLPKLKEVVRELTTKE